MPHLIFYNSKRDFLDRCGSTSKAPFFNLHYDWAEVLLTPLRAIPLRTTQRQKLAAQRSPIPFCTDHAAQSYSIK